MASPRTMWTGAISLGLITMPVTIGKAWDDKRETGIKDICSTHHLPIDRTERCPTCGTNPVKVKGVARPDGSWHAFTEAEMQSIVDQTKSDTLIFEDVQPLIDFPLEYQVGLYFVRHNDAVKGAPAKTFATFVQALETNHLGVGVKWCSESSQRLGVLRAKDGILYLSHLPMYEKVRWPGDKERLHSTAVVDPAEVKVMGALLNSMAQPRFDWKAYEDEGLRLRNEAVEAALAGTAPVLAAVPDPGAPSADNLMAMLQASMKDVPHGGAAETSDTIEEVA